MKKIMWILSFISLVGTAVVLQFLPDTVPMHRDFAGNIDRWGSKYENFIFPAVILIFAFVWTLLIGYFEKKAQKATDGKESAEAKSNAKVISIVSLAMIAMFTIMQGFMLYDDYKSGGAGATGPAVDMGKISVILIGVVTIILGNFMTKTRRNNLVGLRTSWSEYNDNTWQKSNRFAAVVLIVAGIVIVILGAVIKESLVATFSALGVVIATTVIAVVYSHHVYVKEIEKEAANR